MKTQFRAKASADSKTFEIQMYGDVGGGGWWSDGGITDKMVKAALDKAPHGSTVILRVNSYGGEAWQGIAIKNVLAQHKAYVEAHIDGIAASAMATAVMGANKIVMHEGTCIMVHEASGMTRGTLKDHQDTMSALETLNDSMAEAYSRKMACAKTEARALMAAESYFTPQAALAKGLCDEVDSMRVEGATARLTASIAEDCGYHAMPNWLLAEATDAAEDLEEDDDNGPPELAPRTEMESTMNKTLLAQLLGISASAPDEAFEAAIQAKCTELASARADGVKALEIARTETASARALAAKFEAALGATGDAALGALEGHLARSKQFETVSKQLEEQTKVAYEQKRAALVKQGTDELKLTPAMIAHFAAEPVDKLEAFLKIAPPVVSGAITAAVAIDPATGQRASGGGALTWNGKPFAKLTGDEKHNLKYGTAEDKALYEAMRTEHQRANRHAS
jgi:ATP-dependent Clp protease protease subunit